MDLLSLYKNSEIASTKITSIATVTVEGFTPITAEATILVKDYGELMIKSSILIATVLTNNDYDSYKKKTNYNK